jgi:hypothetical protein
MDNNNYPGNNSYDYAFFAVRPDDYGRTVEQVAGSFDPDFLTTPGHGWTQYAYPAAASSPLSPAGLVTCNPKHGDTNYEATPDRNGAAQYNQLCDNYGEFIGSGSGGPLIGVGHILGGVLQGPKLPDVFFTGGVAGAFLTPAAFPLFEAADNAAP